MDGTGTGSGPGAATCREGVKGLDHGACSQVAQYAPWCSSCSEVPHVTSANPAGRVRRRDGATVRIASAHSREAGRRGRPFVSTASPNSSRRCCHGSHRRGRCRSDPEREASGSSSLLPARIASPSPSTDVECGEGEQGLRSTPQPWHTCSSVAAWAIIE